MTHCNRCGLEFFNLFNGIHWCPDCGKMFSFDENALLQEKPSKKKSSK